MPLVNVKLVEGMFSAEQKQQIVRDPTESMVAIEGENIPSTSLTLTSGIASLPSRPVLPAAAS